MIVNDSQSCEVKTAYHEAGHVIAGRRLGMKIRSVMINPNQRPLGRTVTFGKGHRKLAEGHEQLIKEQKAKVENGELGSAVYERRYRGWLRTSEKRAIYLLAGEVAVSDFFGEREIASPLDAHINDDILVMEILRPFSPLGDDREGKSNFLRKRAEKIVCSPSGRRAVKAVAEALLERKTLSGEEVRRILERSHT